MNSSSKKFIDSLKNDPKMELLRRIDKDYPSGKVDKIAGVFGEWPGCDGVIEKVIRPPEGGVFVKIYGCSYLYKGLPHHIQVHGLEFAKSMLVSFPRAIIAKSWLLTSSVILLFLFNRKKFIHFADIFFNEINLKVVKWYDFKPNDYNTCGKELQRTLRIILKKQFDVDYNNLLNPDEAETANKVFGHLLARVAKFFCLFIEADSAYRFRFQDSVGCVDKVSANMNGIKEFFRIVDIAMSREADYGILPKWKFFKPVLKVLFFFSPTLKQFVDNFMKELNADKIKMDEADWYFSLKWLSYNFGGLPQKERFFLRDKIDLEKGHIML